MPLTLGRAAEDGKLSMIFRCFRAREGCCYWTAVEKAPESAPLRVSVLGIGDAVSTAMCEGTARVGHGVCILVGEQEASFTGKIARLLKASKTPVISNISVGWGRPPAGVVTVPESEDDFEMVEEAAGTQKRKTLNIFDE
ncbi:hypothetical protein B0H14DRAFT_2988769, partial [Mycena olivaceomarginata]